MTKKELIDLLNKNFKDDEEVFVQYYDDEGSCVGKVEEVNDVSETFSNGHWEILKDGKWVKSEYNGCPSRYVKLKENEYRYVEDKVWTETKKCIVVF